MSFTIATVNVNGIRAACKQRSEANLGMNAWLETTPADVVLMQEVRATEDQARKALAPALEAGWHLEVADAQTPGAKGRAGVGILSRIPMTDVERGFGSFESAGRWIEATVGEVRLASLYLPSGDAGTAKQDEKYLFLDEFSIVLAERAQAFPHMVVGGDWNICHRAQDLKNNKANEKKSGHLPEERAFMDHVFGCFPDETPQEKARLGEWQGVVEYATKPIGSPTRTRCGSTWRAASTPRLRARTPGGRSVARRSTTTLGGASITKPPRRRCWSALRRCGWIAPSRWRCAGRITRR